MTENERLRRELEALRHAAGRDPAPDDLERVLPVIVPRALVEGSAWPGPSAPLRTARLALVWGLPDRENSLAAIDAARAELWDADEIDWRARALDNLRARTGPRVVTHGQEEGGRLIAGVLMHDDGLGASRVLLAAELARKFPQGYRIAVPDRDCGLVIPADLSPGHAARVHDTAAELYRRATHPIADGLFAPEELEVEG